MHLQEIILCSTSPTSASSGPGCIALHDIQTGSSLASFKQTSARAHSTAAVYTQNGQGGFMLSAQPEKSIMNVYNFQKDQLALKIVLPEKLSCIAVDSKGLYCAGGTPQGRVYLWEIASGIMYNAWDAHYRQVNVLRFTHDCAVLISGSDDSAVSVWSISSLVDDGLQNELPTAFCTLTDHTLPITDIVVGVGLFPTCRLLTASVDHSVKLWDLSSHTLLTTFQFPQPIQVLAWDVTERSFFAASSTEEGSIYQMNLFKQREDKFARSGMEAVGGAGVADVIRIDGEGQSEAGRRRLISAGQPITSLTISLTSSLLLVGTQTGLVQIYDVASHQLLRTVSTHKGFSINYLSTMLKPPDLVGHVSLSLGSTGDTKDPTPVKHITPFQRMRDPRMREAHEVGIMLPPSSSRPHEAFFDYPTDELLQDYAVFVQSTDSQNQKSGVSLQSRVSELETEVAKLREQLGKAKSINDTMWETVVQKMVNKGRDKGKNDSGGGREDAGLVALDGDEGDSRRRKRSRA